jgi:hypothetical protein
MTAGHAMPPPVMVALIQDQITTFRVALHEPNMYER